MNRSEQGFAPERQMTKHLCMKESNVIPITRGKRPRLKLNVSSGACSVRYSLQPTTEPIGSAARDSQHSQRPNPGELLEFTPRQQKGIRRVKRYTIDEDSRVRVLSKTTEAEGTAVRGRRVREFDRPDAFHRDAVLLEEEPCELPSYPR
jgi:hypothetical protein